LAALAAGGCRLPTSADAAGSERFSFVAAGDMRQFAASTTPGKRYFDGVCEALQRVGPGAFMITPGDFDPPAPVRATLDRYLGTNYLWYLVVGNHEIETPADMAWVRHWAGHIPHLVRPGPPGAELTTYSFDFGNSHFVAVNDYFDGRGTAVSKGSVTEATLDWLEKDLAATRQPLIWVIGHQPIESLPDMDSGRVRHRGESVSTNSVFAARFVALLKQYRVRAYLCGHTHNTSIARVDGIWQADSGHARGAGDTGSPSTFLKFNVEGRRAWVEVYRADPAGEQYRLRKTVELD
jgi:3',5'-cyclic AMP phosphodiesterase CpdA